MAKILIVEDEPDMVQGLKDNLEYEEYLVHTAHDGEKGLEMALDISFDLIILDIMLPKRSGFDICKTIRAKGIQTPVLMLTARGQEIDKVLGLELGADDYLTKPFGVRELLARIKAILRRSGSADAKSDPIKMGRLILDFNHYTATDDKGPVELTHKEFEILRFFYNNIGKTVKRDMLLDSVWGYDVYPTSRTVDNYILQLRKKIEDDPAHPRHILTVHGIGYKYIQ